MTLVAINRYALFNMQMRLLRLKGADKWAFKAEREKLAQMSEHDMKEYVAISWWTYWQKTEKNNIH